MGAHLDHPEGPSRAGDRRRRHVREAEERRLRALTDSIPDMVVRYDTDLRRTYVNRAWEEATGLRSEDVIGKRVGVVHPQPSDDTYMAALRRAMETGTSQKVETLWENARGKTLYLEYTIAPECDDDGRVIGLLAIGHDLSERRRIEEDMRALNRELERQVQQYQMLLEQASDAIHVIDSERRYIDVNLAACALVGYTREEHLQLSVPDVVPPEENPGQDARFDRMDAGETVLTERVLRRKDGSLLVAEINSRRLPDGRYQAIVRDITARKELEKEQARLATAVQQADEAIVITDPAATILYVNPAFERVSGYSRDELIGQNSRILHSGQHDAAFYSAMWSTLLAGKTWHGTFVNRRKDGSLFEEDAWITPMRGQDGSVVSYVGVKRDVTRERALEAQLHQAKKMEAIGQLAGGIAHDFNNLITAIRGYGELVRDSLPPGSVQRDDVEQIVQAADRAAELTRQLLAFSRREALTPRVVSPAEIVDGIVPMLRRLLGEDIELMTRAAPDVGRIRADPNMLERVVLNLAVNARDAMPGGGRLSIDIANAEFEAGPEARDASMPAGSYVVMAVADTGAGMDAATRERAFEPFFTTKDSGSGSGMGLATVHGAVKQSGGEILLYSEAGRGTTFRIYLPRVDDPVAASEAPDQIPLPRGSETILLVEDEASVRDFARRSLEGLGYTVIEASNGAEALARAEHHGDSIDLLLTDVVMPGMSGRKLVKRLRASRPDLRVVMMSGFAAQQADGAALDAGAVVLNKPFARESLGRAVRRALDERQ
jgi:two-component system cell cycle sensor histidine kinase/response regulator CckA